MRDAHAAGLDCDIAAIFGNIRAMQEYSGREFVRYPSRPVVATEVGLARHVRND